MPWPTLCLASARLGRWDSANPAVSRLPSRPSRSRVRRTCGPACCWLVWLPRPTRAGRSRFLTPHRTCSRGAVRSVVGLGGMGGAVGGMPIAKIVGYILQGTGSYRPVFISLGSAYLVVLAVIHILAPKLEPFR